MARIVSPNAMRKPTMNDQRAIKHRQEIKPLKSTFFWAKQPSDWCSQASPDAPAWQSTRLAITEHVTNSFLSSTTSRDRSSMLLIYFMDIPNQYTWPQDFAIHLSITCHDWTGRHVNSSTLTMTFSRCNSDGRNPAYFIDSLFHHLPRLDRTTHKIKYFDYDILVVELGWQKSSLLHLDYTTQATSDETM